MRTIHRLFLFVFSIATLVAQPVPRENLQRLTGTNTVMGTSGQPFQVINIPALRAISIGLLSNGLQVQTTGYYASGDGGASIYRWNSASMATDDAGAVIALNTGGTGRFLLIAQPSISVRQWGAYGDDGHDDTLSIQSAITYAGSASVALVTIPPGQYRITSALNLVSNVTIQGMGTTTILEQQWNGIVLSLSGLSHVTLSSFSIIGNRGSYSSDSANAINLDWTTTAGSYVTMRDLDIEEVSGAGILALSSSGHASSFLTIDRCRIKNTGTHGIIVQDYISDVDISENYVEASGLGTANRPCITASRNGARIRVFKNTVVGSASSLGTSAHGISLDTCSEVICEDNIISNAASGIGLEVGFLTAAVVRGNILRNVPQGPAIQVSGSEVPGQFSDGVSLISNVIEATCNTGIFALIDGYSSGNYRHKNLSIIGNIIKGTTGGVGIQVQDSDNVSIVSNIVTRCARSGIFTVDNAEQFVDANTVTYCNISTSVPVVSINRSSTTATVVTASAHGYSSGDLITIAGAVPAPYSSTFAINVVNATSYTYTVASSPATPAVGTIISIKAADTGGSGIRTIVITGIFKDRSYFGHNFSSRNGISDIYSASNDPGFVGIANDQLFLRETINPEVSSLSSGLSANILDRAAVYTKSGRLVIAYNLAGVTNYISIPLDGSTTSWTNSSSAP